MTIEVYQQQLYNACKEHATRAQQALDRYSAAKTDQERERARIDNTQHLAACYALQYALDMTIDFKEEIKQAQIDVLRKLKTFSHCDNFFPNGKWHRYVFVNDIDEVIEGVENEH